MDWKYITTVGSAIGAALAVLKKAYTYYSWHEQQKRETNKALGLFKFIATISETGEMSKETPQLLDVLKSELDKTLVNLRSLYEADASRQLSPFQKLVLLYSPRGITGWVTHLLFYMASSIFCVLVVVVLFDPSLELWEIFVALANYGPIILVSRQMALDIRDEDRASWDRARGRWRAVLSAIGSVGYYWVAFVTLQQPFLVPAEKDHKVYWFTLAIGALLGAMIGLGLWRAEKKRSDVRWPRVSWNIRWLLFRKLESPGRLMSIVFVYVAGMWMVAVGLMWHKVYDVPFKVFWRAVVRDHHLYSQLIVLVLLPLMLACRWVFLEYSLVVDTGVERTSAVMADDLCHSDAAAEVAEAVPNKLEGNDPD